MSSFMGVVCKHPIYAGHSSSSLLESGSTLESDRLRNEGRNERFSLLPHQLWSSRVKPPKLFAIKSRIHPSIRQDIIGVRFYRVFFFFFFFFSFVRHRSQQICFKFEKAQSSGGVEYTSSISVERFSGYNIKESESEIVVMLELWEMRSAPSLPLLLSPDRVLSMGQIEQFEI